MKKLLCSVMALVMLFAFTTAVAEKAPANRLEKILAEGKLTVATSPDYAPYEFLDKDGNPVGSDMTLAAYIAEKLGVELVIEAMDFDTALAAISTGKVDMAIAGLVPKEERKEMMDFTDLYYDDGNQVILILKENAESLKTLADFSGKTVAAQNGTLQKELVETQLPDAKLELITKIPDAIMMVMTKKVDGLALANVVASQYIANYPDLTVCETAFEYKSLGVVAAVVKGETELLEAVNAIVKEVVDEKLYFQWMDEAVQLSNSMNQ